MVLPTNLKIHLAPIGADSKVIDADTGKPLDNVKSFRCGGNGDSRTWIEIEFMSPTIVIDGKTRVIYQMNEDDLRRVAADMGFKLVVA